MLSNPWKGFPQVRIKAGKSERKILKSVEKSANSNMRQEMLKVTKSQEKVRKNRVNINMKPLSQIMAVNVMMWLHSNSAIAKKMKKIRTHISMTFGRFVNQAIT